MPASVSMRIRQKPLSSRSARISVMVACPRSPADRWEVLVVMLFSSGNTIGDEVPVVNLQNGNEVHFLDAGAGFAGSRAPRRCDGADAQGVDVAAGEFVLKMPQAGL